jgi:uncharacterized repeat protein (TIGR01451 family)
MSLRRYLLLLFPLFCSNLALAFVQPGHPPLPDFDNRRRAAPDEGSVSPEQRLAAKQLQSRQPKAQVDFDPVTGGPKSVSCGSAFLTGSNGVGGTIPTATAAKFAISDPHRGLKAFLHEYTNLFRHGPEVLDEARVKQEFVTAHNGLRTVVWQQEVGGIPVFEATLISHATKRGELVSISDRFLPDAAGAAQRGGQDLTHLEESLSVSARRAVALAATQIDEQLSEEQVGIVNGASKSASVADLANKRTFRAPVLKGDAEASVVWLPMNSSQLRLCWDVILTGSTRGEMYRVLVDAQTGEPLLRRCLTHYISAASYRVYTNDSPAPFSPTYPTPTTNQPPLVSRALVTISALDTNASPNGWINDGDNQTLGNNVDAHTDTTGTDQPDLPRPQGSPSRVFDFPLDLTADPSTYRSAAIVQLFYWCNWMHDQLYDLGFTEAAGNFQSSNFGRGGLGNDALLAEAQDGAGFNNANFATPPDGSPPRMQMYLWNGPTPDRDGDLDAQIVLHEYTHGLSSRRVGGGLALNDLQPGGMAEGWSDFYALSLLSKPGDDVDGVYAVSQYSMYRYGGMTQNYYFGVRRYPCCTDLQKSPLTFKDIDPTQADAHTGIPRSPVIGNNPQEPHNMGEVWCVTLWEARANLIRKLGTAGNRLLLQIVTDAMPLTPPEPTFLEARDAILQAEQLDSGGTNQVELWNAFAKRGMGQGAAGPSSGTTISVHESFDVPDGLQITPASTASFSSLCGQPLVPSCQGYVLSNNGSNTVNWTAWATESWVSIEPTSGSIPPGGFSAAAVCLTAGATTLPAGENAARVIFSNTVSTATAARPVIYHLSQPALCFPLDTPPAWKLEGEWALGKPAGQGGTQYGNSDPAAGATGTNVLGINLNGDYSTTVGGPYHLTAGPFDFSGYSGMTLQFQRWLNTDFQPYVYATIEVSSDGTNWNPVWDNGTTEITDSAWTQVAYDISATADNQSNVFVRWGHQVASALAFPYSGWNIDDIEFVGTPSQQLTVAVPATAKVGVGTLSGTVSASPAPTNSLTITLSSSDPSAASVPASVVVPAGQTNVGFNLTVANQLTGQANEAVLVHASAPGYVAGSGNIQVLDTNALALHLSLPATAFEGEGAITGAVFIRDIQTNAFLVQLSSSDTTALQVPDSAFIPVGQTTAVFTAQVQADNLLDGPKTAVVTAHFAGWTDAAASVVVQDNKSLNLAVALPASVWENSGTLANGGSVAISGVLPTNLTVFLTSSVPARLSVPTSVTIPSGQVSNTFSLSPVDNAIADGNQAVTIGANALGFSNGTAVITVLDDETPSVPSNPSPANLASNVVQTAGLSWQQALPPGETITNDVYFGTVPTPGPAQLVGSTTNQAWTLPVLVPQTIYYWQIVARRVGVTPGPVWQFTTRGVDHFSWNTIPAQYVNQPFPVGVTALDAFGSVVSNFTGSVSLSSQTTPVLPTNSRPFINGAWQGPVTISQPASQVSLLAKDAVGHTGASSLFNVLLTNDLSIVIGDDPDPVPAGMPLTYTLVVANSGAASATGVTVTNTLPPNVTLRSVVASQGAWQATNGVVTAALGLIPGGTNATLIVVVVPSTVGDTLTNTATVTRFEAESYLDNNTAVIETQVGPPAASIADAAVIEGATGTTNMPFAVTLSAPSPATVSLNYATADGSAIAGQDYLATNGVLVLPPGTTNGVISVAVLGDVIAKSNEVFYVNISGPTNAVLGRARGVGTILELAPTNMPATILGQPTNQIAVVGGTANFGVIAEGTPPLRYQWRFNGTNVAGATNSAFVKPNLQLSDSGSYAVVVSNAFGGQLSSNAVLTVGQAPAIVSQPASQTVRLGDTASFTVGAAGTAPLAYQWNKGGTNLLNATNHVLGITNVQSSDAGSYAVRVSNLFGSATSTNAVLTIGVPPSVTSQPTNLFLAVGAVASFNALVAGTPPLTYQWTFNGTNLLLGTDSQLVLTNVQLSDSGTYALSVSNLFGSATSSNALLRVGQPPGIVVQPTNQIVGLGTTASFAVGANGTAPLLYQWRFGGTNLANATNSVLVLANVQSNNIGSYAVRVFNAFGTTNSTNALLAIGPPPVILVQPTSLVVTAGTTAGFKVLAGGAPGPFTYQWGFNGTNLLNATNSVLVISNAQASDAGTYAARASNAYGSTDSSNAVLFVAVPPAIVAQPTNQLTQLGSSAVFSVVAAGTAPLAYQWSFSGTNLVGATSNVLVVTNVQLDDLGSYAVQVTNAFGSTNSASVLLAIGGPASIVIPPTNQFLAAAAMATLSVVAVGTPPLSYQWAKAGGGGGNLSYGTNSVLIVTNVHDGDKYNVKVSNSLGSDKSPNVTLHVGIAPTIAVQPTNQPVTLGAMATFSVVANGDPPLAYQWLFNGRNLPKATNSVLVVTNVQSSDAGRYGVKVSNPYGSVNSDNVTLSIGQPPGIVAQPTNQTVRLGQTASFRVTASGTTPLSYQWSFNGTNLAGAVANVLLITNAQVSDSGSYAVLVSNPFGATNSATAMLSVGALPVITTQPTNLAAAVGGVASFGVVASGTPSLSYQWTFNSTNVLPVTNSILVITNVQFTNAGTYAVQVLNAFGAQQSSNAVLSVGQPPAILVQPTNQLLVPGGVVSFAVSATGTAPLSYQWRQNGTNLTDGGRITGSTNTQLTISHVALSDSGAYSVLVSNGWGSVLSSNAVLSVAGVDHFGWDAIPSPRFIGTPFSVRIQALDATNGLVGGFAGSANLGTTASIPVTPSVSGGFVLGTWTGSVTISQAATGAVLIATDGLGHSGLANAINVVALPSLSVVLSGASLIISWPALSYFTPETSPDLVTWSPLNTTIDLVGNTYQARVPISAASAFFRVRFIGP